MKADINTLERVQMLATKVGYLAKCSYEKRLQVLGLTKLEERRRRGDLILKYKLEKGLELINWLVQPLCAAPRAGRRSRYRREIVTDFSTSFYFYSNRVVTIGMLCQMTLSLQKI